MALQDKIAIIGIDCKFPADSEDPKKYWDALLRKRDGIVKVPEDRWDHSFYYDQEGGKGKTFVEKAGFANDIFDFSPAHFGISEKEAIDMDPQQRLLIQSSWNSIQNAGYNVEDIKKSTGVFFGLSYRDYYDFDIAPAGVEGFTAANSLGNVNAMAAGRVAYLLGLNGPSIQIDTICSSSLMTLHIACQSLLANDCDYALSGAANCILSPHALIALAQMGALSKSAKCQAFSKHADGYIRGEGVGIMLLKRLKDATRDGDFIYGIVEGTATNHDGRSNGLTAPNGKAQIELIKSCLQNAGLEPKDIGYVETHGTGTYLGDPVELEGLFQVFGSSKSKTDPLYIGSVKSNLGHLEPAAGVASLIKSLLILQNEQIPPGLHLEELNPGFKWEEKPIKPVKDTRPWKGDKRHIGVSAFSMTGANVHVILGTNEKTQTHLNQGNNKWPILISAPNDEALKIYVSSLLNHINVKTDLSNLSLTLLNGRERMSSVLYGSFDSIKEVADQLQNFLLNRKHDLEKYSIPKQQKSNGLLLLIGNFSCYHPKLLSFIQEHRQFSKSTERINYVLKKLTGKTLSKMVDTAKKEGENFSVVSLELKIIQFAIAFILVDGILSFLKKDVSLDTADDGDYLGAILGGVLTLEEAFMLYLLGEGAKRSELLNKIEFEQGNGVWKQAEKATHKVFWKERNRDDSANRGIIFYSKATESSVYFLGEDSLENRSNFSESLLNFWVKVHLNGVNFCWKELLGIHSFRKESLPPPTLSNATYISDSYRINSRKPPYKLNKSNFINGGNNIAAILHREEPQKTNNQKHFISTFSPDNYSFIYDHKVQATYIFPGSGYVSMVCEALYYLEQTHRISLKEVQIFQPMVFVDSSHEREVHLNLMYDTQKNSDELVISGSWEIQSDDNEKGLILHIKGSFEVWQKTKDDHSSERLPELEMSDVSEVDIEAFYASLDRWGVSYGSGFRLITQLSSEEKGIKATVNQPQSESTSALVVPPESLDASMHALFSANVLNQLSVPFVPSQYHEIQLFQPFPNSIHSTGSITNLKEDALESRFRFHDPNGVLLMEIKSMECRKIRNEFLIECVDDTIIYEEKWHEIIKEEETSEKNSFSQEIWFFADRDQAIQTYSKLGELKENAPKFFAKKGGGSTSSAIQWVDDIADLNISKIKGLTYFPGTLQSLEEVAQVFKDFKELIQKSPKELQLSLCTSAGVSTDGKERVNPLQTALWGLARTLPIEAMKRWRGVVDLPSYEHSIALLYPFVQKQLSMYDQLAVRGNQVFTPILSKKKESTEPLVSISESEERDWKNPVLISGGLGQMGRFFTKKLVERGCKEIYILSRDPSWLKAKERQLKELKLSDEQLDFRSYIKKIAESGVSIIPVTGRVYHKEDMMRVANHLKDKGIKKVNFIHAAGSVTRKKLVESITDEWINDWQAKYTGALQFNRCFSEFEIGYMLYTSSIASLWSGDGVSGYASANLLLDGLAINNQQDGKRTLSVRFGRFTEQGLMKDSEAQELEESGVKALSMEDAIDQALSLAEETNCTVPSIMKVDWTRFAPLYQSVNRNLLTSEWSTTTTVQDMQAETLKNIKLDKPLKELLIELVAEELEIAQSEINSSIPLFELGLDSMHSLGIRTDLEKLLEVTLSVSLIYDYNTIDLLSEYLETLTDQHKSPKKGGEEPDEEALMNQILEELD